MDEPQRFRAAHRQGRGHEGPQREKIVAEISAARDEGDLKENGGYHAAREAQGRLEGEIAQLAALLLKVDTTEPTDDGIVGPGKVVTFKFEGDDDDEAEVRLIAAIEMDDYSHGLEISSPQSPVGGACWVPRSATSSPSRARAGRSRCRC